MKHLFRSHLVLWTVLLSASIVPFQASGQDRLTLSTIVIDPGHGGHDPGCISPDKKTYEKNIALDIAKRLSQKIAKELPGVKTVMTRSDDTFVTLSGRADIANNSNADLFISIHVNAQGKGTSASGYSIHCLGQSSQKGNDLFSKNLDLCQRENSVILLEDDYKTRYQGFDPSDPQSYILFSLMQNAHLGHSLDFAEDVAKAMKGGPISHSRGVSQDPFWVLWSTTMPSVLIEVGFITNAADRKVMASAEGRDGIAANILRAIKTFKARYDHSTAMEADTPASTPVAPKQEAAAPVTAKPEVSVPVEARKETTVKAEPRKEETVPEKPQKEEKTPAETPAPGGILYGIQVVATSKQMKASDPFFKGYAPLEVQVGKLYKYILVPGNDLDEVRKKHKELSKQFPECFIVSKEGESLTRIR
jgi:N-acetylmuramoyl-L-alanine amidase